MSDGDEIQAISLVSCINRQIFEVTNDFELITNQKIHSFINHVRVSCVHEAPAQIEVDLLAYIFSWIPLASIFKRLRQSDNKKLAMIPGCVATRTLSKLIPFTNN